MAEKHLQVRRPGSKGTVGLWVPGHGGDVWWVLLDGDSVPGAYSLDEIEAELETGE